MCHSLDLEDRLPPGSATLAPADILLTKLQIYEVNDKDLIDSIALLLSHPVISTSGGPGIDTTRLAKVTGSDWGWHTTLTDNLTKVSSDCPPRPHQRAKRCRGPADRGDHHALAAAPKSLKWRARAKVGRRVPWYDLPEEVG